LAVDAGLQCTEVPVLLDKLGLVCVARFDGRRLAENLWLAASLSQTLEILERRARENQVDFVEGVAIALTPLAFYEVVMAKAFRTLVDDGTEVSVETGLRAAEKLQSVLDGRERGTDVLELKVQLGQISQAVRAVVPESMWAAIVEKLEELEEQHPEALDVGEAVFDDADDDAYDPMEFAEDDDEF
jgi:hypothetical protein